MSTAARKRLMRDFKRLQKDPPTGIVLYDNQLYHPSIHPSSTSLSSSLLSSLLLLLLLDNITM
jgi:hypothetical protein